MLEKLVEFLLPQFGKLVIGAILFSGAIWGLAHYSAAPATHVSVLWGLVEYTKMSEKSDTLREQSDFKDEDEISRETASQNTVGSSVDQVLPKVELDTWFSLNQSGAEELAQQIRKDRSLRPLQPMETGRPISSLPNGTYAFFFVSEIYQDSEGRATFFGSSSPTQKYKSYIELHSLRSSSVLLIGYALESDAIRVSRLPGTMEVAITVSPVVWNDFDSRIEIPLDRIVRGKDRRLVYSDKDEEYVLDLTLK